MSTNRLLMTGALFVIWLSGCAQNHTTKLFADCIAGQECSLEGKLRLYPGEPAWAALLVGGNQCAKLALPDSFFFESTKWNDRRVRVTGRAFQQPEFDEAGGQVVLWYTEQDRKLALGMCDDGLGIYVNSIRSNRGDLWPALE